MTTLKKSKKNLEFFLANFFLDFFWLDKKYPKLSLFLASTCKLICNSQFSDSTCIRSAHTYSIRLAFADLQTRSQCCPRVGAKNFFYYISCYSGQKYFALFDPFFNILGDFLYENFWKSKFARNLQDAKDLFWVAIRPSNLQELQKFARCGSTAVAAFFADSHQLAIRKGRFASWRIKKWEKIQTMTTLKIKK